MDNGCRAIRTAVVDDKDVKALLQGEDGTYDVLDILFLVVSGNDYDRVTFMHDDMYFPFLQNYKIKRKVPTN